MQTTAETLKQEGISSVLGSNKRWAADYMTAVRALPPGEYTGEDIRLHVVSQIGEPKHHNAWGGAMNRLLRDKSAGFELLKEHRAMKTLKSHARKTPVYRKVT